jgi:hypothetical protein
MGSHFHHGYVSRGPPIIPDGGISPVRFETLAFPLWAFPAAVRFKRGDAIRRYRPGMSTGSLHACHGEKPRHWSGHHAAHEAAKCPEPLCLDFGVTVIGEISSTSSDQRALPLLPRSYGLMRRSHLPLPGFGSSPRLGSLRRLSPPCCEMGPSRCYLCESFPRCQAPYSGGPTGCTYLFLPLRHRPSPGIHKVGFPRMPAKTTS